MADALTDRCVLHCVEGPDMSPVVVEADAAAVFGRMLECDVVLADPVVSRRHARISRHGESWILFDLSSSHGTMVNSVPIPPEKPVVLTHDDVLVIGPWRFRVELGRGRQSAIATLSDEESGTEVRDATELASRRLAARQLEALIQCAASMTDAEDERALAKLLLPTLLTGSGFSRAALLRPPANQQAAECVAVMRQSPADDPSAGTVTASDARTEAPFSRSLLRAAAAGDTVRLQRPADDVQDWGRSIAEAGVTAAICSPVHIGGDIVAHLYIDATDAAAAREEPAEAFCNAMARLFGLALANIRRRDLERRSVRMEAHLAAAHEAQRLIVPAAEGTIGGLRWSMRMRPGHYVAGDLFDIIDVGHGLVGVCIGDVTGEGIDAAVLMAAAQAHLHAALRQSRDPAVAVRMVNQYVADRSPLGRFITLWVGLVERNGGVRYVDAGHGHWMHLSDGEVQTSNRSGGIPLGIEPGFDYEDARLQLSPGDRLVLYTDGVCEQANDAGEQFSQRRLVDAALPGHAPTDDVRNILGAVEQWAPGGSFDDDVTVASIQYAG